MRVIFGVKRGNKLHKETEEYKDLESATRGIQDRISDPFSPEVENVLEIKDSQGRAYSLEWSCLLMPKAA